MKALKRKTYRKLLLFVLPFLLLIPIYFLYFGDVPTDRYFPLRKGNYWKYHVTERQQDGTRYTSIHTIEVIEARKGGRFKFARLEYRVSRGRKVWMKAFTAQAKEEMLRFFDWNGKPLHFWPHLLRFPLRSEALLNAEPELYVAKPRVPVKLPRGLAQRCYYIWGGSTVWEEEWWFCLGVGIVKYRGDDPHLGHREEWILTDYRVR